MGATSSLKAALLVLGLVSNAHAGELGRIGVQSRCGDTTTMRELVEVLAAELAPAQVVPMQMAGEATDAVDALVVLDFCRVDSLSVEVASFEDGAWAKHVIELSDVPPEARARTIGIALTDALRQGSLPPSPTPALAGAPPPASPDSTLVPAPASPPRDTGSATPSHTALEAATSNPGSLHPFAAGQLRLALNTKTAVLGLHAGAIWERLSGGLLLLGTQRATGLGRIGLYAAAATVGFDLLPFSFGAVFARGELGVALATGSARSVATSSSGAAFHGALALGVRAGPSIGTGRLDLALDLGAASTATAQMAHHDELSLGTWVITATAGIVFP